ncbi:MAG: radical SAM protein [Candidatus Bathyarchaeota archaeon]|nr:MAG: radical SAM protein [Candidatus Bathyarchaeota archaeon]
MKTLKVSFIQPKLSEGLLDMCSNAWPPLGILYCATMLANEGVEVSILDQAAEGYSTKETASWIKKEDPDLLGLSVLGSSSKEAGRISELSKEENQDMLIAAGNYQPTFNPNRMLRKYKDIDIIVRGEGEYTCLELMRCLEKNGDLKTIDGITFRRNAGKIVSTPDRPLIKDIDILPFPHRQLANCEYASRIFGMKTATKRFTSMLSSRGCPFHCTFCSCRKFAQGVWRPRSITNILEELEYLVSEGYREFLFVDDNFTLNPHRVIEFCRALKKKRLKIEWFCDSRVDNCGFDTFREMVKAGCRVVYFGIESANQRILDYYKKNITPQQSIVATRNARKAGVDIIVGSFIVGAPDESRQEIQNTLNFAQKIDIDVPSFNILGAPVGSPLWNELQTKGYILDERDWEENILVPQVCPTAVPFKEVGSLILTHFKAFYLRPRRLIAEAIRTATSSFRFNLLLNNLPGLGQTLETVRQGVQFK